MIKETLKVKLLNLIQTSVKMTIIVSLLTQTQLSSVVEVECLMCVLCPFRVLY